MEEKTRQTSAGAERPAKGRTKGRVHVQECVPGTERFNHMHHQEEKHIKMMKKIPEEEEGKKGKERKKAVGKYGRFFVHTQKHKGT